MGLKKITHIRIVLTKTRSPENPDGRKLRRETSLVFSICVAEGSWGWPRIALFVLIGPSCPVKGIGEPGDLVIGRLSAQLSKRGWHLVGWWRTDVCMHDIKDSFSITWFLQQSNGNQMNFKSQIMTKANYRVNPHKYEQKRSDFKGCWASSVTMTWHK